MTQAHDDLGVTLNDSQQVFVIRSGGGYGCFGYDNCMRDTRALAERLGLPDRAPEESDRGTLRNYALREELLALASTRDLGTWFTPGTPPEVQRILEDARRTGDRLKLTLGDRETGRDWGGRPEVGGIGRSGGILKTPLLVSNRRSMGGGAILTDCIVKIETSVGSRRLWAHPTFHVAPEPGAEPEALPAPAP
jgi:hypothetical protein